MRRARSEGQCARRPPTGWPARGCATWESGPTGPFDHWPAFSGFERFYGFIGGETNQWQPALVDGVSTVEPPDDRDYHLVPDVADKTIEYICEQKSLTPDKPFFVYLAPGATHTPHHVPAE